MDRTLTTVAATALLASAGLAGTAQATTAPAQATTAAASPDQPRSAIPWRSVGVGWSAMTVDEGHGVYLMLASPQGRRYVVTKATHNDLVADIRPDGHSVVLYDYTTRLNRVVDLTTGRVHRAFAADNVQFSRPTGQVLVTATSSDPLPKGIQQRDMEGRVLKRSATSTYDVTIAKDGRTWVANVKGGVYALSPATMAPGRRYAVPAGFRSCTVVDSWDATTFVEQCTPAKGSAEVFTQKYTGGAPVQRTWGRGAGASEAFFRAYPTSIGTVALATRSLGDTESQQIATPYLVRGRTTSRHLLPRGYEGRYTVTDIVGSAMYTCTGRGDIGRVNRAVIDIRTNRVVPLGWSTGMAVITGR